MDETKSQGRQRERGHGEREDRGCWSTRRRLEIVLRILKGEDLDALSHEVKLTAARLSTTAGGLYAGHSTPSSCVSLKGHPDADTTHLSSTRRFRGRRAHAGRPAARGAHRHHIPG